MTTDKWAVGGVTTPVLNTELNALGANGKSAPGPTFDNTAGLGVNTNQGDGYLLCDVELVVTYGVAPAVTEEVWVWFLRAVDGTDFEDGSSSVQPVRPPDVTFGLRAVTTLQRVVKQIRLPWGKFKALAKNASAQTTAGGGVNFVNVRPATTSGV